MEKLLSISDLTVAYGFKGTQIPAVTEVSLDIPTRGDTLGLVGESGSGKTTLGVSILNMIEPPGRTLEGRVEYQGRNVFSMSKKELKRYRWEGVSMIYQSAMNSLNPVKRIYDPIVEVLRLHLRISKVEAFERCVKLLSEVGIKEEFIDSYPHELSGGMRQRVVTALALALSPKLLIADEPTSALDVVVQKQILALLEKEIAERQLSLIFITHEISLLSDIVQRVAVMYAGEIVEIGSHDLVIFEPLHPYTEMLLKGVVTMDSSFEELSAMLSMGEGSLRQLFAVNACRYADRCKYAFERCRVEKPKLREVENGRWVACHKYS